MCKISRIHNIRVEDMPGYVSALASTAASYKAHQLNKIPLPLGSAQLGWTKPSLACYFKVAATVTRIFGPCYDLTVAWALVRVQLIGISKLKHQSLYLDPV